MIETLMAYLWEKYEKLCVKIYAEYFKKFLEKKSEICIFYAI